MKKIVISYCIVTFLSLVTVSAFCMELAPKTENVLYGTRFTEQKDGSENESGEEKKKPATKKVRGKGKKPIKRKVGTEERDLNLPNEIKQEVLKHLIESGDLRSAKNFCSTNKGNYQLYGDKVNPVTGYFVNSSFSLGMMDHISLFACVAHTEDTDLMESLIKNESPINKWWRRNVQKILVNVIGPEKSYGASGAIKAYQQCGYDETMEKQVHENIASGLGELDEYSIRFLVSTGYPINGIMLTVPYLELTFLHWAVSHNKYQLVKFLLENGAEVNIKDDLGQSPLDRTGDIADESDMIAMIKLLAQYGALPGDDITEEVLREEEAKPRSRKKNTCIIS